MSANIKSFQLLICVCVFCSLGTFTVNGSDWQSPDPKYQAEVDAVNKNYRNRLNRILSTILEGSVDDVINGPKMIDDLFLSANGMISDSLPKDIWDFCWRQINDDWKKFQGVAVRRQYQIGQKILDGAEIKKAWTPVYDVFSAGKHLIVPPPEGFSVFVDIANNPQENGLIGFQPINPKNVSYLGDFQHFAKLSKWHSNDDSADTLSDFINAKLEIIDRQKEGTVIEDIGFANAHRTYLPFFIDNNRTFAFGFRNNLTSTLPGMSDKNHYTAIGCFFYHGALYRVAVDGGENSTKANEAWADAVLIDWLEAILRRNPRDIKDE